MTHKTPFLVNTKYNSMDDYIKDLKLSSKKNYKKCLKLNSDIKYEEVKNLKSDESQNLINRFCNIWKYQKINCPLQGNNKITNMKNITSMKINWNFAKCFVAKLNNEIICIHLVEKHNLFMDCQMPMYDKNIFLDRMISKFMWFKIIEYAINREDINWVDMWSCPYNSVNIGWRDIITNRNKYNLITPYKYRFLSIKTKNNPDKEPNYIIICNKNGLKFLKEI